MKTGNTERIRVRENGDVGIGTNNPGAKLHVAGSVRADHFWDEDLSYYADLKSGGYLGGNWTIVGNVGIGLNPTTSKLHVSGDIRGNRFFDDDYSYYADLNSGANLGGNWIFNGSVGIGMTNPSAKLDVAGVIRCNIGDGDVFIAGNDAKIVDQNIPNAFAIVGIGDNNWGGIRYGMNGVTITGVGGLLARSDNFMQFNMISDKRTKKDIVSYNGGLDLVKQLEPVKFKYNGKARTTDDGAEHISFIAQDLEKIPELASLMIQKVNMKLEETDANTTEMLTLNASALPFILVNAIKEQQKQIEELKAELQELKKK
jgi:hypothetical protein